MAKVVDLRRYTVRKRLVQTAFRHGWHASPAFLPDLEDPLYLYLVEPCVSREMYIAVMNYADLAAIERGKSPYGKPQQAGDLATKCLVEMVTGQQTRTPAEIEVMFDAMVHYWANTTTAATVAGRPERIRHIGCLLYRARQGVGKLDLTLRPVAFHSPDPGPQSPIGLVQNALQYMDVDYRGHPEYFDGIDYDRMKWDFIQQYS